MRRRDILKALPCAGLAALPAAAQVPQHTGVRLKITDIRLLRLKVIKDLGTLVGFNGPWDINHVIVGGGTVLEVRTDQGLIGIGSSIDPVQLPRLRAGVIGRDAFDVQRIMSDLRDVTYFRRLQVTGSGAPAGEDPAMPLAAAAGRGGDTSTDRAYAALEIALWDLIGKACNMPLYKMWGQCKDRVVPYASQSRLGDPKSRAEMSAKIKADGWRAVKYRAHFHTMKDDIALVEETRKLVGDDFDIMCDANQATNTYLTPDAPWEFERAVDTARAYKQLKVYWLEEPLGRYDLDRQAELNRLVDVPLAGGEGNRGLHEFRDMILKGSFDIVQPEILLMGPMEFRKIAAFAEVMDKRVSPHLADGRVATVCNMHLVASLPNVEYLEIDHDLPLKAYSNGLAIFEDPPVFQKGGYFNLPDKPGLGVTINKDLILS
ncbi:MAG TPA: mandelate racemase/muconate lactonizing enzyme family protein [Caulobacterales bacterium]|nr:mandelate racemase/muconate lactonizing enzyme family protein [Caulobacterales bacterium]